MSKTRSRKEQQTAGAQAKPPARSASAPADAMLLATPFVLIALLRAAAIVFPEARLWGVNHFAYLPSWVDAAITLVSVALCLPAISRVADAAGRAVFGDHAAPRTYMQYVLAACAAVIFWMLRLETYFLGDGAVYLAEHFRFTHGLPFSADVLYSKFSAPLTAWILAQVAQVFYGFSSGDGTLFANPQIAFWITGVLTGGVFVVIAWRAAAEMLSAPRERFAFFTLLCTAAGTIFFFGYVEYYTFLFTALTLYFLLLDRAARGKGSVLPAAVVLALASGLHFLALIGLPALLFVLAARSNTPALRALASPRAVAAAIALSLLVGGAYYFLSSAHAGGSRIVLTFETFGGEGRVQSYSLLSSMHLADFSNYLVLLAAPALIALAFIMRRSAFRDATVLTALVNTVFLAFLAFFGNTAFGLARDWDIVAVLGVSIAFLLVTVLRAGADGEEGASTPAVRTRNSHVFVLAAGASLAAALLWWAVNIDVPASVARFRAIMALDDRNVTGDGALNGYEHLRKYYQSAGDTEGVAWAIRRKVECVGYPTDYRKLALAAIEAPPSGGRRPVFEWMLARIDSTLQTMQRMHADSLYAGSRIKFTELAAETILQCEALPASEGLGPDFAMAALARFVSSLGANPVFDLVQAQLAMDRSGAIADPAPFLRAAEVLESSPSLCLYAGRALASIGMWAQARPVLERGYTLDPTFTLPLVFLAAAEYQISPANADAAVRHLETFIADPAGHRLGSDQQTEARLMAYAQSLLAHIRQQQQTR